MNTDHLEEYQKISCCKEDWSRPERILFIDWMISRLAPNKKVIETGCRTGLFCYSAFKHNAEYVTGIEHDPFWVRMCGKIFEKLNVPKEKYKFEETHAELADYSNYDVAICTGLLYNLTDKNKIKVLNKMNCIPQCLIEFWCFEDDNPEPHTTIHKHRNGYKQFMPNQAQAELFLRETFYQYEDITPEGFQGFTVNNKFYLCQPLVKLM